MECGDVVMDAITSENPDHDGEGLLEIAESYLEDSEMENSGVKLIAIERREQIEKHGRTLERDDIENAAGELALGAEMLLAVEHEEGIDQESYPGGWDKEMCLRMINKPQIERLIIAGALIAAEIDRLSPSQC
jgi:hypothetical protein